MISSDCFRIKAKRDLFGEFSCILNQPADIFNIHPTTFGEKLGASSLTAQFVVGEVEQTWDRRQDERQPARKSSVKAEMADWPFAWWRLAFSWGSWCRSRPTRCRHCSSGSPLPHSGCGSPGGGIVSLWRVLQLLIYFRRITLFSLWWEPVNNCQCSQYQAISFTVPEFF